MFASWTTSFAGEITIFAGEITIFAGEITIFAGEISIFPGELRFFRQPKHPKVPHLRNGGIALEHFRQLLRRLFGVEISQHVLEDEDQMGPSAMRIQPTSTLW